MTTLTLLQECQWVSEHWRKPREYAQSYKKYQQDRCIIAISRYRQLQILDIELDMKHTGRVEARSWRTTVLGTPASGRAGRQHDWTAVRACRVGGGRWCSTQWPTVVTTGATASALWGNSYHDVVMNSDVATEEERWWHDQWAYTGRRGNRTASLRAICEYV